MPRPLVVVGGLVVLAAALRLVGLDAKGYWEDEAATVALLRLDLGEMLTAVVDQERTPPLYYLLAWPWSRAFGEGEVGLRSLSALIGAITVPVAYLAARELVSSRAGLVAAALVAVNPLLVWYSQEARAYALLVLLSGTALYFFARSLREPTAGRLALWSATSVLAMATHYFAAFLFGAEATWLLVRPGARRAAVAATSVAVVAAAALAALAIAQRDAYGGDDWIPDVSLLRRVVEVPGFLLVGFELSLPLALVLAAIAAALAGVGLLLLATRGSRAERRGALVAGSVAAVGLAIPIALAPLGIDAFLYRNVIAVLVPLAILVAAGLGAARAGAAGALAGSGLVALSIAVVLATSGEPKYQREAWREAAEALGEPVGTRAIVSTPGEPGREPLQIVYLPDATLMESGTALVREIDLLALPRRDRGEIATASLPDLDGRPVPPVAAGFRLIEARREAHLLLFRYRAHVPRRVSHELLESLALDDGVDPLVLLEEPSLG